MPITGRGGVPVGDVSAVALNVTVTQPAADGYLTLFPAGAVRPLASNVNFVAGETVSNLVVVQVGAGGKVSLFDIGATHVVADVVGWYSGSGSGNHGRYQPVLPSRIVDTRSGIGDAARLGPGATIDVQVAGRGGVPITGVEAGALNVTVTNAVAAGFLTTYPSGEARPLASNLTFAGGSTVAGRTFVKLGAGGRVSLYNGSGSVDVIIDATGWFTDSSASGALGAFQPLVPARILDTRNGTGGIAGPVPASGIVDVQVTGRGGVPSTGVRAVILNATVTGPTGPGFVTIFPTGTAMPPSSDLNFATGETQSNLAVVQVGAGGTVSVFSLTRADVVLDVAGWMS